MQGAHRCLLAQSHRLGQTFTSALPSTELPTILPHSDLIGRRRFSETTDSVGAPHAADLRVEIGAGRRRREIRHQVHLSGA